MQQVLCTDLGLMNYQAAWNIQEALLRENVGIKSTLRTLAATTAQSSDPTLPATRHFLLFVEHPPVYTLGKSGHEANILISREAMNDQGIAFYQTNRGGDITFHGPGQVVGYPILDLEKFKTDIGLYLRNLEEVIIRTIACYGLKGERSAGETGVWLDATIPGKARKICAMGVRCSRWVTMHGFALNANTDLDYFSQIVPCGIADKAVTSIAAEKGEPVNMDALKQLIREHFAAVFGTTITEWEPSSLPSISVHASL